MKANCEVCSNEIEVQMCCDGKDCGCLGLPIEPPVCSNECLEEYYAIKEANKERLTDAQKDGFVEEKYYYDTLNN